MYPNLYYVFKDWFGVEWQPLSYLNTFGLLVALSFVGAATTLSMELRRKEKQGLFTPVEESIVIGKAASITELLSNGLLGFLFGYKFLGLFLYKPEGISAQDYIFSGQGFFIGGLLLALAMAGLKWWDKRKLQLPVPEKRILRIWPHDRVGDMVILALVFGILGAKLFDNLEHWDEFWSDPIGKLFSPSGLTFYGGLIVAAVAVCWYAYSRKITVKHLVDAAAPGLMLAYAIGRIGCQISGDGDWGIYNSAYKSDNQGKISVAKPGDFEKMLTNNATYFLEGKVVEGNSNFYVTDRTYTDLKSVPRLSIKAPSFLPTWLYAYSYPRNVNKDGILMPGVTEEHNRTLPSPVFPTPLYETLLGGLLFFLLWIYRRNMNRPLMMFAVYLFVNGAERYLVEMIRVNKSYGSVQLTQAEIIALGLMLSGMVLALFSYRTQQPVNETTS